MNKIMERVSLKRLFIGSLISTIGFLVLFSQKVIYAIHDTYCLACIDIAKYATLLFMTGVTTLILSIIFFLIKKQQVFEFWKKTLLIYLSIYLVNVLFMPWYWGDEFLHIGKGNVSLSLSAIYLIFSLILITYNSLKKEPQQNIVNKLN